jgi:hypothetical protein
MRAGFERGVLGNAVHEDGLQSVESAAFLWPSAHEAQIQTTSLARVFTKCSFLATGEGDSIKEISPARNLPLKGATLAFTRTVDITYAPDPQDPGPNHVRRFEVIACTGDITVRATAHYTSLTSAPQRIRIEQRVTNAVQKMLDRSRR